MNIINNVAWIICLFLFIAHQITQKLLSISIMYLDSFLDPLLCLPIFMGMILIERRYILSKREINKTYKFSKLETIVIAVVLSIVFEEGFSRFSDDFTKDYLDYLFY